MTAGLEVTGITVAYGRMPAVRDLSLSVARGELAALLGRNGAGKTTTLRALSGLQRLSAGAVRVDGRDLANRPAWRVARAGVAMVLEGARIFGTQTVGENLELGRLVGARRGDPDRRLATLVDAFPVLRDRRDDHAALLSGGERQQLAIAQALVAGPSVLLLDEPSVGLAPALVARVFTLLDELRRSDADAPAILVAEQLVAPVLRVADHAYVIDGGRLVAGGTADSLRDAPELLEAYLGKAPAG